jgi:hypothetical protein
MELTMGCMELGTCYLIWGRGVKRSCLTGRHHLVPRTCGDEGAAILRLRGEDMRHFEDINIACKFFTAYSGIGHNFLSPCSTTADTLIFSIHTAEVWKRKIYS